MDAERGPMREAKHGRSVWPLATLGHTLIFMPLGRLWSCWQDGRFLSPFVLFEPFGPYFHHPYILYTLWSFIIIHMIFSNEDLLRPRFPHNVQLIRVPNFNTHNYSHSINFD